jgi:plastocyanin
VLRRLVLPIASVGAIAAVAAFILLPTGAAADNPTLKGTVGPGFNISLTDANGAAVSHLATGTYTIVVNDQGNAHNFHLSGTGVDQATGIEDTGTVTWTVTLTDGIYTFRCDAHPSTMKGSFAVGTATLPPPPPPPSSGGAKGGKLKGSVGPGYTISLKDTSGKRVKKVKTGRTYTISVADKSSAHNFHLIGSGVNKKTSVGKKGTTTWKLKFRKGTYRYRCDPHRAIMKGSFKAS